MAIQIRINNHTYNSISAAWRALSPPGLPMITVRWRLNNGWQKNLAFTTPRVEPAGRRQHKVIRENIMRRFDAYLGL